MPTRLPQTLSGRLNANDGQLYLVFQPQCDHTAKRVAGVEALLRWDHPIYGPVAPPIIVALAEDTNLIDRLGKFVLLEACKQRAAWHPAVPHDLVIAVNITPSQLRNANFAQMVLGTLHVWAFHPPSLNWKLRNLPFWSQTPALLICSPGCVCLEYALPLMISAWGTHLCVTSAPFL